MNDNAPLDPDDLPGWAWDIVERHDLGLRAASPQGAVNVLLADAAFDLGELGRTTFREQAFTPVSRERAAAIMAMIADALALAPLCPAEPEHGEVIEREDGTLSWSPLPPAGPAA